MRRFAALIAAILLLAVLAVPASASSATGMQISAVVSTDGSCKATVRVNLMLDQVVDKLTFPLPSGARNVTVNGTSVSTFASGGAVQADISRLVKGLTGNFTLEFQYVLSGCVASDNLSRTIVTVPLLNGFTYTVDNLSFHITLPGEATAKPTFTSGYYQSSIETMLDFSVSGQTISGYTLSSLQDLETLSLSIEMPPDLFPQQQVQDFGVAYDDVAMYICGGIAMLYWLLFLRCLPPRRVSNTIAPEGYTAGELRSVLTTQGADLTMMVMTWAQLGYILIHLDKHGRVMLHKRMEMGNERSGFENRIFRSLFGRKQTIDGGSYHYAALFKKVSLSPPNIHDYFRPSTGNPVIFRCLACLVGLFGGMSLGFAMGQGAFLSGLVVALMIFFGIFSSWYIQAGAQCLHLHDKYKLWICIGCIGAWLIFGFLAEEPVIAASVAGFQFLVGLAATYGGRRTDVGRQAMAEVLGLRRYMRKAPKGEFQRITRYTPDYFFALAPSAIALGVGDQYARQFGSMLLPGCPYLTTGMDGHRTAAEWMKLMHTAVKRLDHRHKHLLLERLFPR